MKRPFAIIGFTLFAALYLLFFTGRADAAFSLLCASVFLAAASVIINRRVTLMLLLCGTTALACLLFLLSDTQRGSLQSLAGDDVYVEAVVSEPPYRAEGRGRHYAVCRLKTVAGENVKGKLRLSFSPSDDGIDPDSLDIGNRISFTGKVYLPGMGEKAVERNFFAKNIFLGAYGVRNLQIAEPAVRNLTYYFSRITDFVKEKISGSFGDDVAGLLLGILTGDKSLMDSELYNDFKISGVSHLAAVSGLHLSVWMLFAGSLIPDDGRAGRIRAVLLVSVILFVMLLAGMSKSVVRAGIMSLIFIGSSMLKRETDCLNNLGVAVFLMLLFDPWCALSISFQLSAISTLSVLTVGKALLKRSDDIFGYRDFIRTDAKRFVKLIFDSVSLCIGVIVFTAPIMIYNFSGISTVSLWTNLLVVPVSTPLIVLTGVYVIVSPVKAVAYPVSLVINVLAEYAVAVVRFFAASENAFLSFEEGNYGEYILGAGIIAAFFLLIFKKNICNRIRNMLY